MTEPIAQSLLYASYSDKSHAEFNNLRWKIFYVFSECSIDIHIFEQIFSMYAKKNYDFGGAKMSAILNFYPLLPNYRCKS